MEKPTLGHHNVAHLQDIGGMDVIVVLYFTSVALKNLLQEAGKNFFIQIGVLVELKPLQDVNRQHREC